MPTKPHIPLDQCVKGGLYRLASRNLAFGVYNGIGGFVGIRHKWEAELLDTEWHADRDNYSATAYPMEFLEQCPVQDLDTFSLVTNKLGEQVLKRNRLLYKYLKKKAKWYGAR